MNQESKDNPIYCNICTEEILGELIKFPDVNYEAYVCEECYDIYINVLDNKKKYANKRR